MKNLVIAISRQFGSGGRTIGKNLAERLGVPCYDQEIIEQLAKESGLSADYIAEKSEYTNGGGFFASVFTPRDMSGKSIQDEFWINQNKLIKRIANEGSCVIVGRCADYILKDQENIDLIRVFIYSDMDKRAERIVKQYGESNEAPEKRLRDKDKRRAAYYNYYTDTKWGDPLNNDLCLNSGSIGIDKCVDILAQIVEQKK